MARDKAQPPALSQKTMADTSNRSENRKAKRHLRREQLYIAVRESMTRSGVLAASYKFKVLSLDQRGDEFLVMLDVDQVLGRQPERLAEIEAVIVHTAKARFDILVTSVYARMEPKSTLDTAADSKRSDVGEAAKPPLQKPAVPRFEPIHDDEVAAFRQALVAASANSPVLLDAAGKSRSGLRSYAMLTGFEDTEMPESAAVPALSATQYGDLS